MIQRKSLKDEETTEAKDEEVDEASQRRRNN